MCRRAITQQQQRNQFHPFTGAPVFVFRICVFFLFCAAAAANHLRGLEREILSFIKLTPRKCAAAVCACSCSGIDAFFYLGVKAGWLEKRRQAGNLFWDGCIGFSNEKVEQNRVPRDKKFCCSNLSSFLTNFYFGSLSKSGADGKVSFLIISKKIQL